MRLKFLILVCFGLMFVAGLEVGRSHTSFVSLKQDFSDAIDKIRGKAVNPPTTQPTEMKKPQKLFGDIDVTTDQDKAIHQVFHEAKTRSDVLSHQFHELDHKRDEQIIALLDPVQKAQYDLIEQEHDAQVGDLRGQIRTIMDKAGDDVRALLTPDQQKKYDEDRKRFAEGPGHHNGNGPWRGGPPGSGHHNHPATTQTSPATQPANTSNQPG